MTLTHTNGQIAHSAAQPNDTRLQELFAETREFGRLMAQGKDALPMLAHKVARAAADGVISTDKDKDGEDDYTRIYADFIKAASKKAVHEHTTGGIKANASKLRQVGMAASKPTCDFIEVLNRVVEMRAAMIAKDEKVKAAYPTYVDAAREQIKQDDDLTDAQIAAVVRKPEAADPDVEKILARVEKTLSDLISGEKNVKCDEAPVVEAHSLIRGHLAQLMHAREVAETMAKAKSLGLITTTQAAA